MHHPSFGKALALASQAQSVNKEKTANDQSTQSQQMDTKTAPKLVTALGTRSAGIRNVDFYTRMIFERAEMVLLGTIFMFAALPLVVLFFVPLSLDNNPEKGFDTHDTSYSGPRLAWMALQPQLLQGSRVIADVNRLIDPNKNTIAKANDTTTTLSHEGRTMKKRSWADDLIASFGSVACYDEPIPAMSYLAQFMITVPEYENLYSRKLLTELCRMQNQLADALRPFDQMTPYRQIWHLGQYFACLAPESRSNCSYITATDIMQIRNQVEVCIPHRKAILICRRHCQQHHLAIPDPNKACPGPTDDCQFVPKECAGQMWFDLFYRILPKDMMKQRPLHLNAFLPVYSLAGYRSQGFDVSVGNYIELEKALKKAAGESKGEYKLKGMLMDIKRDILLESAIDDSKFSLLAGVCVFLLVSVYSLSICYSLAVLVQLISSVISALAIYRWFNPEFPLLNLIVFVLLISIGSDGAFLLLNTFPKTEKLNAPTLQRCLRRTAKTMFLTQFSTVVPFLLNIFSNVVAFRNFGLFAGLTLVFNYLLLISLLPAFLVLQHRRLNPWLARRLPSSCWYFFPTTWYLSSSSATTPPTPRRRNSPVKESGTSDDSTSNNTVTISPLPKQLISNRFPSPTPSTALERACIVLRSLLHDVLPEVLIQGRFVWISSLTVVLIAAVYVCVMELSLPQYNPLQLFGANNVHEYYDNNAERLFEFVSDKIAMPLMIRLVWGFLPIHSIGHFNARQMSELEADPNFNLTTMENMKVLAKQLERFRKLPFIQLTDDKFWPEKYLIWSERQRCAKPTQQPFLDQSRPGSICCNFQNAFYSDDFLDFCMRLSTTQLRTHYNDTPIYHNVTLGLIGYTALLTTKLRYSHRFANLSASFELFDKAFRPETKVLDEHLPMWYTTEWHLMSTWYDLQRSIISDCKQSIVVSFIFVFIFSAIVLKLKTLCAMLTIFCIVVCTVGCVVFLGWEIGVLEGVILVLVVGLSFDYTLHYGASVPDHGCPSHRIKRSVKKATVPVGMAAASSVIAGGVMLFAETHAFFQVAVFLVVCSSFSFIFATFFFLPLLYIFLPSKGECGWCCATDRINPSFANKNKGRGTITTISPSVH